MDQVTLWPHWHLRSDAVPFPFDGSIDPIEFADKMAKALLENGGIGLAANQIKQPYAAMAVAGLEEGAVGVMYNPRIVHVSDDKVLLEEGCLSFPGVSVKVKRPAEIRVRYTKPSGETVTEKFTGMTSRVIQHEMDHLLGRNFLEMCSTVQKEKALKTMKKVKRAKKKS